MNSTPVDPASLFAPLLGQMAWQVRADEHACVMMEFGAPHLDIREPRAAPEGSNSTIERLFARRAVYVVGDWHLWIESCNWTLTTRAGTTTSAEATADVWRACMDDLAGQHLAAAESQTPGALTLRFDAGALLDIRPDAAGDLDSWSLHRWEGDVVSCSAAGHVDLQPPTVRSGRR